MAGDHFEKIVNLGSGSYGNVWLVSDKRRDRKLVLKEINLRGLNDKDIDQAMTEIEILSRCNHQHIISYCESFLNQEVSTLSIVMEHASMGDLHQQITDRRGLYFPDEVILRWFSQLISALHYIHSKCILHRDVKPQNLFLTSKRTLKLGDFGISRVFLSEKDKAFTLIGTPFYLSPEVCRQEPYASDLWAAGCVLYELCCLCVPFTASNMAALAVQIESARYNPIPLHCGQALHKLVQSLLTPDPKKRLTADAIHDMDLIYGKNVVDSTTYTVVKHPKKTRPSLASPELSAMLHKQRTQSFEGQRAVASAGNPSRNPRRLLHHREKRTVSPCFNLFENECVDRKRLRKCEQADTVNSGADTPEGLDSLIKEVYKSYSSSSSQSDGAMTNNLRNSLIKFLGYEVFENVLSATKKKTGLKELEKIGSFSPKFLPLFLLYIQMAN